MNKKPLLLIALLLVLLAPNAFSATVEGRLLKTLNLTSPPVDIAISPNGQRVFVLEADKLSLFKIQGELLGEYPLDKQVSSIKAQGPNLVLLYSAASTEVDYLYLEVVHQVDVTDAPTYGPADAPVTITLFDDFQCPYCAKLEPTLKQVQQRYPKQVRVVFRNFPLGMHKFARPAALAALAAERQGKFWEFHDQLFANYNKLSAAKIEEIATLLKLNLEQFKKDMADPAIAAKVDRDLRDGSKVGVSGTPSIFINGRQLQDRSFNGFRALIEAELRKPKTR